MRLADLGYFRLTDFTTIAAQGAYGLSRCLSGTVIFDATDKKWSRLTAFLTQIGQASGDVPVTVGVKDHVPSRLVAVQLPQAAADKRRRQLHAAERKHGQTPSAERLALCDGKVFLTHAPETLLTIKEILVLARARWHIELMVKQGKSYGGLARWTAPRPFAILCHIYAKMLAMIGQQGQILTRLWAFPHRSLYQAAKGMQKRAFLILTNLWNRTRLKEALNPVAHGLPHGCLRHRRAKKPSTFQLLLDGSLLDGE